MKLATLLLQSLALTLLLVSLAACQNNTAVTVYDEY